MYDVRPSRIVAVRKFMLQINTSRATEWVERMVAPWSVVGFLRSCKSPQFICLLSVKECCFAQANVWQGLRSMAASCLVASTRGIRMVFRQLSWSWGGRIRRSTDNTAISTPAAQGRLALAIIGLHLATCWSIRYVQYWNRERTAYRYCTCKAVTKFLPVRLSIFKGFSHIMWSQCLVSK